MRKIIKIMAIAYVILGISYLSFNLLFNSSNSNNTNTFNIDGNSPNRYSVNNTSINQTTAEYEKYFCGENVSNYNFFIKEFVIPNPCSQPVGLTVDNEQKIWIGAMAKRAIFVFDPDSKNFTRTITIPSVSPIGNSSSMIWDMKFDKNGDLWFTDRNSNSIWRYFLGEDKFENYIIPTKNSYPISLVFDTQNRIWFAEVFGKKLGVLDMLQVKSNTTNGIKEFNLPESLEFETLGPISISHDDDKGKERLWFSTISYPDHGEIVKFDILSKNFTVYNLGVNKILPISVIEDKNGKIWTNDHASNIFLSLDLDNRSIEKISTSPPSTRNTTNSLPYYNIYKDGKIWFNEHEGNAIASYDPENSTLIEYHIPTRNPLWGNTSNPLKFVIDDNNSIWFTEWTENKIGSIDNNTIGKIPIKLTLTKNKMILDTKKNENDTTDIYIFDSTQTNLGNTSKNLYANSNQNKFANISIFVTSSISESGKLTNLSYILSQSHFQSVDTLNDMPLKSKLSIFSNSSSKQVEVGNYTLTVSARYNNEVTISKIIDLEIK